MPFFRCIQQALVDLLSHDGRQRRRDGRPDLGGGAGAQRYAGHVGVGDRRPARPRRHGPRMGAGSKK